MKIAFIINPAAGKNKKIDISPLINKRMKKLKFQYNISYTKDIDDARKSSRSFIKSGYDIIVGVGGDGTIREVAKGIQESGRGMLGILPMGTGNDLARSLDIPLNVEKALEKIIKHKTRKINVGKVDSNIFLNIASIGLDAEIVKNTQIFKSFLKGKLAYTMGILRTLIKYNSKQVIISYDKVKRKENILLIAVANGNYYGGGMKITPEAKIDDDKLDICLIKSIPKFILLFIFPSVYSGNHGKYKKYVEFIKVDSLSIQLKEEAYLNIDGDISLKDGIVEFDLSDRKIKVIV